MMVENPLRWMQRFSKYNQALAQLSAGVELATHRSLSELEQQGLIHAFEFCHELAWNIIKDYFIWQGNVNITGPRDAVREAFSKGLIEDGEGWMEMTRTRSLSSRSYNKPIADEIVARTLSYFYALFQRFDERMQVLANQ